MVCARHNLRFFGLVFDKLNRRLKSKIMHSNELAVVLLLVNVSAHYLLLIRVNNALK